MNFITSLKTRFYAPLNFGVSNAFIEESVAAFFDFLTLPDEVKNHIDFTIAPEHRRGDVGYKKRQAEDHIYNDNKEFFHYHPAILEKCAPFIDTHPLLKTFLYKADVIWQEASKVTKEAFDHLAYTTPNLEDKIFKTQYPHILLRFLRYEWHESGKYLAKPHFDAGSCTLAIAESCSGLRIGSGPENLSLVEHQDGQALFMLSSNVDKMLDTSDFMPGWHDVIQIDESHIGKPYARWAVVAFMEVAGVSAQTREHNHRFYKADVA